MMDRLQSMAVFVATVETGSMAAAARALGLQASVVSRHIRQLEDQLGVPLFERQGRWQKLTGAGRPYHQQCRSILEQLQQAEAGLQAAQGSALGPLRLHAPVGLGTRVLAPALGRFLDAHPHWPLELVLDDHGADPEQDDFDLVLHLGHWEDDDCALHLGAQRLVLAASPAYLARHGEPRDPDELVRHRCLGLIPALAPDEDPLADRDDGFDDEAFDEDVDREWAAWDEDATADGGVDGEGDDDLDPALAPSIALQTNSPQALHQAALGGAGIVLLPELLLGEDLAAGRLVPLLAGWTPPPEPVHLRWSADAAAPVSEGGHPGLMALVDFIAGLWAPAAVPTAPAVAEPAPSASPLAPAAPATPAEA